MPQRSHGQKTGIFHDHFVIFHHIEKSHDQLIVRNRDNVVKVLLNVRKDLCTGSFHCSAVCNCIDAGERHDFSRGKRCLHTAGSGRFHADHPDSGVEQLCERGDSCRKTSAADWHENILHQGELLKNLHGDRPLSGRYHRIIKRMNKRVSFFVGELKSFLTGLVVDIPEKHDFGPIAFGPVDLDQRRGRRHHNDGLCAEAFCSVGHALGVVAGGRRNQSALPLLGA